MLNRSNVTTVRALLCTAVVLLAACSKEPAYRTFATPEEAVRALDQAVEKGSVEEIVAIFGPEGKRLLDSADPVAARQSREVFAIAMKEGWQLADAGEVKTLVVGNESWPFPVPLVREKSGWRFDTAAGSEEIIARRIGRNELAVIRLCRGYVVAQQRYAKTGHDDKPAGLYAVTFRSDPGRQNGLYWPAARGEPRSPLGDLIAEADGAKRTYTSDNRPAPFHGYYFKILTAQGGAAADGPRNYVNNGEMTGGFALVAWPAEYDVTGVMSFLVNQDGIVHEKDLGPGTPTVAERMTLYNPDDTWKSVQ